MVRLMDGIQKVTKEVCRQVLEQTGKKQKLEMEFLDETNKN